MPRGNDQDAALHELADRFGQGVGNAELLIDANLAANTQALRKAQILPRDEELTAEAKKALRDGDLKHEGPNGERVVSIAVRGSQDAPDRYTVVVVEDDDGRHFTYALDDEGNAITDDVTLAGGDAGRSAPDIDEDEAEKRRSEREKAAEKGAKDDDTSDETSSGTAEAKTDESLAAERSAKSGSGSGPSSGSRSRSS